MNHQKTDLAPMGQIPGRDEQPTQPYHGGPYQYPNGFEIAVEATGCAFVAREWHGGQWCPLYAFGCGDFSPATVERAAAALERAVEAAGDSADADAFWALDDLQAWAAGVAKIKPGPVPGQPELPRHPDYSPLAGQLRAHSEAGGYPILYLDKENNVLCPCCAREAELSWHEAEQLAPGDGAWLVDDLPVTAGANYEEPATCDQCSATIEAAYG